MFYLLSKPACKTSKKKKSKVLAIEKHDNLTAFKALKLTTFPKKESPTKQQGKTQNVYKNSNISGIYIYIVFQTISFWFNQRFVNKSASSSRLAFAPLCRPGGVRAARFSKVINANTMTITNTSSKTTPNSNLDTPNQRENDWDCLTAWITQMSSNEQNSYFS